MKPFEEIELNLIDLKTRGLMGAPELRAVYDYIVSGVDNPLVVELGAYCGAGSFVMANAVSQKGGRLVCVDCFKTEFDAQTFSGNNARREWHRVMDGFKNVKLYDIDTIQGAVKFDLDFGNNIDFLFVDADHSYNGVLNDLKLWSRFVKPSGVIVLHDYYNDAFPGVKLAAEDYLRGWDPVASVWSMLFLKRAEVA